VTLCIKLIDLTIYLRIKSVIDCIFRGFIAPNGLQYVGSAAPTSRVYASSTGIQLIAEHNNLWHYATLQWHDVLTKNREYQ
jgi:hypothetical protein